MDGPYGEDLPFKVTINRAGEILLVELPRGLTGNQVSWNCKQVGEVGMRCGQRCCAIYLSFFLAGGLILPP